MKQDSPDDASELENPSRQTGKKILVITETEALVLRKKLRWGQQLCLIAYLMLLLSLTANYLLAEQIQWMHWLVSLVPLIIFLPGFKRPHHRTYSWLCFVLLMYFLFLVPLLMSHWSAFYWFLTLLVTFLFVTAMMTSRWLQYWNYYLSTTAASSSESSL